MTRVACFLVPMFCLAARLRSEPDLRDTALVITAGNGSHAHVAAATRRARKQGVRAGLSLPQTRAILPNVIARSRDAECERAAQEALLEIAERFSPRIEDAGDGIVYADVTGMHVHFTEPPPRVATEIPHYVRDETSAGTVSPSSVSSSSVLDSQCSIPLAERNLALEAMRCGTVAGLPIRVGVAGSKLAARIAAELPHSPHVIPPGEEQEFLAPLPIERLSPELEAAAMLERWGLSSIGDLATLPEGEVATRLGEIGRMLHYAARGIDARPIVPRQPPPVFEEGMELEWPVVQLEPFLFVANAALDRLAQRLEARGFSCRRIEVTLRLEPEGFYHRGIDLPAPTRDVKTMLTLFRLDLEANPPGAPVSGFTFVAHPDKPRRAQLSLFGPPAMSPDKLAATIAKIASIVGPDRVGSPRTVDGHLPERFQMTDYHPPAPPEMRRAPVRGRGLLAMRVIRPPVELEVVTSSAGPHRDAGETSKDSRVHHLPANSSDRSIGDAFVALPPGVELRPGDLGYDKREMRDGDTICEHSEETDYHVEPSICIKSIRSLTTGIIEGSKKQKNPPPLEISGPVRIASGPWRLEEGWWTETPSSREYWDVEVGGSGIYRVFRERDRWFVDGVYD